MTTIIVGALVIVALLLFCVVVALGGAMLAISAAEPPSPWDNEQSIPRPDCELLDSPYSAISMCDDDEEEDLHI